MKISNMHEAKTHLSRLIKRVLDGEEVIIAKSGKPMAKLVPYAEPENSREPGVWKGDVWMDDDFNEEFEEINKRFYGDT